MARRLVLPLVAVLIAVLAGIAPGQAAITDLAPCDATDPALCLLPFPNDRFTKADPTTATGRRIDFLPIEMPRSILGKPIDPTEWNRNDGFSPGSMLLTFVKGLDLRRTWGTHNLFVGDPRRGGPNDPRDHIADIGRYLEPKAPILIIDASTGERWPFWSELDMNAQTPANKRLLILRPAVNFREGHRYLVALRNMRRSSGEIIPATAAFATQSRSGELKKVVNQIASAERARGNTFNRSELFLAWSFTVASRQNLTERVLHIRDESFRALGDTNLADGVVQGTAPAYAITTVTPRTDGARQRQVEGTITVPNYLVLPPQPVPETIPVVDAPNQAIPLGRFLYGIDGLPMQNPLIPTIEVPFVCTIPAPATAANPAHPTLYGHGLLGSRFESTGGSNERNRERNYMACATNWMGFAEYDVANAVVTLLDPSNMPSMIDRSQQGFLNWLFLARAIVHPDGLSTAAAFKDASGAPLFRVGELVYDGNSQGAIMGGALTALSVDLTRSVLGVPGMNYSTLLNRSVDWEGPLLDPELLTDPTDPTDHLPSYSSVLYTMFPRPQERQLVIALIQMLWDRGEGNGYAQHMTDDALPNTPAHRVLLHVAFGDFQVTNVSAEVEARTIGARVMDTALLAGRHWEVAPYFDLASIPAGGWAGSGLVYWDSGNLPPPNANVPPDLDGGDPHEDPRRDPRAADQKVTFWLTGTVVDVMSGGPYLLCRPGEEANIPRVPSLFNFDWCV